VQLSNEMQKQGHGCLYSIFFGLWYWTYLIIKVMCKWAIGCFVFFYDAIAAIIAAVRKKGYVWKCKKWFQTKTRTRQIWYCHDCGNNFRA
jgi:hypothetical protein